MSSTFGGIEIGARALQTNQGVLDMIGHNVANVNTPGYTRQAAELAATAPAATADASGSPYTLIGNGVELTSVNRVVDEFVNGRLGAANADQGKFDQLQKTLQSVQNTYDELGTDGLGKQITATFNAFQQVAQSPETTGPRVLLVQQAQTLTQRFQQVYNGLGQIDQNLQTQAQTDIQHVNDLAKQVADLNKQIQLSTAAGAQPNDLKDKRDQAIQQISNLVGATAVPEVDAGGKATGAVRVLVGGFTLVQDGQASGLPTGFANVDGVPQLTDGNVKIPIQSGEVSGMIQATNLIAGYRTNLNAVASTLITSVNAQHQQGYGLDGQTGRPFFSGTDASNIAVAAPILADPNAIAASSPPPAGGTVAPSNGDNATAIADIGNAPLFGAQTIVGFHSANVTQIGADAQSFTEQASNQKQVVQQLQTLRNSTSGVSLDEELTNMLTYQRSYQAAARLVNTFDSLLNGIINTMGTAATG